MRQHTLVGERILRAAPALHSVAKLVRSSHERFDGTGYPDGLVGQTIPLGARIVSACDAWDAMTTTRPYRHALSTADALRGAAALQRHAVRPGRRAGAVRGGRLRGVERGSDRRGLNFNCGIEGVGSAGFGGHRPALVLPDDTRAGRWPPRRPRPTPTQPQLTFAAKSATADTA